MSGIRRELEGDVGEAGRSSLARFKEGETARINCRRLKFVLQIVGLAGDSENEELNQGTDCTLILQPCKRESECRSRKHRVSASFTLPNMKQAGGQPNERRRRAERSGVDGCGDFFSVYRLSGFHREQQMDGRRPRPHRLKEGREATFYGLLEFFLHSTP